MEISVISAYETSAQKFFETLAQRHVDLVLDVRLHNTNQLAGFTKERDLDYFTRTILHADYVHDTLFSPEQSLLESYLKHTIDWDAFSNTYKTEMEDRDAVTEFFKRYGEYDSVALVGTATRKRRSHVEVLQSMLNAALSKR